MKRPRADVQPAGVTRRWAATMSGLLASDLSGVCGRRTRRRRGSGPRQRRSAPGGPGLTRVGRVVVRSSFGRGRILTNDVAAVSTSSRAVITEVSTATEIDPITGQVRAERFSIHACLANRSAVSCAPEVACFFAPATRGCDYCDWDQRDARTLRTASALNPASLRRYRLRSRCAASLRKRTTAAVRASAR